jgi:hypothetical protein
VAATEDIAAGRRAAGPIPVGQCPARLVAAALAADIAAHRLAAVPTAAHQAAALEEAAPEADRAAALPVADTITTKKFPPRFTPYLTHRQEAPKGASCPPSNTGR